MRQNKVCFSTKNGTSLQKKSKNEYYKNRGEYSIEKTADNGGIENSLRKRQQQ